MLHILVYIFIHQNELVMVFWVFHRYAVDFAYYTVHDRTYRLATFLYQ